MKGIALVAIATAFLTTNAFADGTPTDAQVDAAMKKADADNDGTVSLAEARKFGISGDAFMHANPDKDGSLDAKEFLAAVTWQFDHSNKDKDGTLDKKEAGKVGVRTAAFDAADADKDGSLDLGEYLAALTAGAK